MILLIVLTAFGVVAMMAPLFRFVQWVVPISLLGLLAAGLVALYGWNAHEVVLNHMMRLDNFALAFIVAGLLAAIGFAWWHAYADPGEEMYAETMALLLFAMVGMVSMTAFTHLLVLFVGIEIMALSFYILAGMRRRDVRSNEASLKYFLMGAFSTGILLLGIAFIYGTTQSFFVDGIARALAAHGNSGFATLGMVLILAGMFFKVSAVPFQFWTPDVYQGAPTPVTALLATAGKVAAFAAMLRLLQLALLPVLHQAELIMMCIAGATILVGNVTALYQKSMKRMLAYSSIAHAGYMLMAMVEVHSDSAEGLLFYSIAYVLASLVAFSVVDVVEKQFGDDRVDHFRGLWRNHPILGLVFVVSMLSLAGIPATAGFIAKFYVFALAIGQELIVLSVIGVVGSFIGVYYYFRPMLAALAADGESVRVAVPDGIVILLVILTLLTLFLGLFPGWVHVVI